MRAIAAGRHVFLEKPPAATLGGSRSLARSGGQSQGDPVRQLAFALCGRPYCQPASGWRRARSVRVTIHWKENIRQWHPGQKWIMQAGGMGVFDPGINALSILTHLMPQRVVVKSADLHVPENCQAPIRAELDMTSAASPSAPNSTSCRPTSRRGKC
ncbi:MAG: hypothetical protein WDN06_07730 [Asticcacaulis sp.]